MRALWRPGANVAGGRDYSRNPAACTQREGAVGAHPRRHMGYPAPFDRRTLRRVARAAQDCGVADVERGTARGERLDVIDGQVGCPVGGTAVAGAPVAVLATPGTEHPSADSLPGPRAVQGIVAAAVRLPGVLGTATARAARDDAADRTELHGSARSGADSAAARLTLVTLDCRPFDIMESVGEAGGEVYTTAVLRLRDQPGARRCERSSSRRSSRPRVVSRLRGHVTDEETPIKVAPAGSPMPSIRRTFR
jgi:hypothetical protein